MPSLQKAKLKHAQYFWEVACRSSELYTSDEASQQAGLELFDVERGQIDEAWDWLQRQPSSQETDVLLILFAEAISAIGMLRYSVWYEHIPHFEVQLVASRRVGWQEAESEALANLGLAYAYLGYYHQAIGYFESALIIAQKIGDQDTVSDLRDFLRQAHGQMQGRATKPSCHQMAPSRNDYQAELARLTQALHVAQSSNNRMAEARILDNLGILHSSMGDYETALLYHERARNIYRGSGHHLAMVESSLEIAAVHARLGNGKQCLDMLQPMCDFFRENAFAHAWIATEIVELLQQLLPIIEELDRLTAKGYSEEAARFWKQLESAFQWIDQAIDMLRRGE